MKKIDFSLAIQKVVRGQCPVCDSYDTEAGKGEPETITANERLCNNCYARWVNEHDVTGFHFGCVKQGITDPAVCKECLCKCQEKGIENNLSYVDVHKVVSNLLENKKLLPTLIGIDKEFDKLIEERLRS